MYALLQTRSNVANQHQSTSNRDAVAAHAMKGRLQLASLLPESVDTVCNEFLAKYFKGVNRRTLRSVVRTREVFSTFMEDFTKLRTLHPEVNVLTYNTALHYIAFGGNVFYVGKIWAEMLKDGVKPNVSSYNNLLRCAAYSGNVRCATNVVAEMRRVGVSPNGTTYINVMMVFARRKDLKRCRSAWEASRKDGYRVTPTMLSILLNACDNYADTQRLIKQFKAFRIAPREGGYSSILNACGTEGDADQAERVMRRAMADVNVKVDYELWVSYLYAMKAAGDHERLTSGLERMTAAGFSQDVRAYSYFIESCRRHSTEKGDKYMKLGEAAYESAVAQQAVEVPLITQMMRLYSKHGMVEETADLRSYLHDTMRRGDTHEVLEAMREAYVNAGRPDEAKAVTVKVYKYDSESNLPEYKFHANRGQLKLGNNDFSRARLPARHALQSGFATLPKVARVKDFHDISDSISKHRRSGL